MSSSKRRQRHHPTYAERVELLQNLLRAPDPPGSRGVARRRVKEELARSEDPKWTGLSLADILAEQP